MLMYLYELMREISSYKILSLLKTTRFKFIFPYQANSNTEP